MARGKYQTEIGVLVESAEDTLTFKCPFCGCRTMTRQADASTVGCKHLSKVIEWVPIFRREK